MSKRINTLVIGAPGWLGTRLVHALSDSNDSLQKYSISKERNVRALILPNVNISSLPSDKIEMVKGNVLDQESLKEAMKGIDIVFYCVGLIHPKKIQELFRINVEGTKNALEAATNAGVKRFIYISSNSPAGFNKSRKELMKETDKPKPYMAYGKSKFQAEKLINQYHTEGKLETVILRPCWFYGPGQPDRQLRFFDMIKAGNPIMFGDGKNLRSMSFLDNTVQAMLLAEKTKEANGETYWIADDRPYSTDEIYRTVAKLLGSEKKYKPRRIPAISSWICGKVDWLIQKTGMYSTDFHVAGEMAMDIACDISKAKKELGYKPEVSLEEGMKQSIEYAKKYQGFKI